MYASNNVLITLLLLHIIETCRCVTVNEARRSPLSAYVLTDHNGVDVSGGGVRIGALDLQHETAATLAKYGLARRIIVQYQPYLGHSGQAAEAFLRAHPLQLTRNELDDVVRRLTVFWMPRFRSAPSIVKDNERVRTLRLLAVDENWVEFLQQVALIRSQIFKKSTSSA